MYSLDDFRFTLNKVLTSLEENHLTPARMNLKFKLHFFRQVRMVSLTKIQVALIMKLQGRFHTCQDVY